MRIVGPRLLAAGRDLGATASNVDPGGGLSQIADGPWALRKAVREQRRQQVDIVKIFIDGEAINPVNRPGEPSFRDEEVAAISSGTPTISIRRRWICSPSAATA